MKNDLPGRFMRPSLKPNALFAEQEDARPKKKLVCFDEREEFPVLSRSTPSEMATQSEDAIDSYMKYLEANPEVSDRPKTRPIVQDDDEDFVASYIEHMERRGVQVGRGEQTGLGDEVDSDEEVYQTAQALQTSQKAFDHDSVDLNIHKSALHLPEVDHSIIKYDPSKKCFYEKFELAEISKKAYSDSRLMMAIEKLCLAKPTFIRTQLLQAAFSGRDLFADNLGEAEFVAAEAYLLPLVVHVADQRKVEQDEGPIALILTPSRKAALDINPKLKIACDCFDLRFASGIEGESKFTQSKVLQAGAEVVVATPRRLVELIKGGISNLRRVTFVVLDAIDVMLEMGHESMLNSILQGIRPDRQASFFSLGESSQVEDFAKKHSLAPLVVLHCNKEG